MESCPQVSSRTSLHRVAVRSAAHMAFGHWQTAIVGRHGRPLRETFFFDLATNTWPTGPNMGLPR
jgi:hypothetical protein